MAEEITNTKYIVFNREEFNRLSRFHSVVPTPLDDAVVIRRRDIFAGPGLHAYAMAIQTAIDLLDIEADIGSHGVWDTWNGVQREQLEALRDFFATQAQLAVDSSLKHLPD